MLMLMIIVLGLETLTLLIVGVRYLKRGKRLKCKHEKYQAILDEKDSKYKELYQKATVQCDRCYKYYALSKGHTCRVDL